MQYHFPPISIGLFATVFIALMLVTIALRSKTSRGSVPFALCMISLCVWVIFSILEWGALTQPLKIFWSKFQYIGITTMPVLFFVFAAEYSRLDAWINKRTILLMSIIPIITLILVASNEHHRLIWSNIYPSPESQGDILVYEGGIFYWVNAISTYIYLLIGNIFFVRAFLNSTQKKRYLIILLIIAVLFPWMANFIYITGRSPIRGLDLTPFAFLFTCVIFTFLLFRNQLFSIVPIARNFIFESMQEGIVVVDSNNILIDMNPVAKTILGIKDKEVVGKLICEVLAAHPQIVSFLCEVSIDQSEIVIESDQRYFVEIKFTPLYDKKSNHIGHLIVMRDITGQKLLEAQKEEQHAFSKALRDSMTALNSSLNLTEVLDRILDNVDRVVPHDAANIALVDNQGLARFYNIRGYEKFGAEQVFQDLTYDINSVANLRQMAQTGKPVIVPDTHADVNWYMKPGLEWLRSYIGAPIMLDNQPAGFLNLDSATPNFYTQQHTERLQVFADQAAIAVRNAQLYEEQTKHAKEMSTLYEVGLAITAGLDLAQVIEKLDEQIRSLVEVDIFYLALYTPDTGMIEFPICKRGKEVISIPPNHIDKKPGLTGQIIKNKKKLYIPDFYAKSAKKYSDQSIPIPGDITHTFLGIPLMLGDHVVGVISIQSNKKGAYSPEIIRLMETLAVQASIAINNARLFARMEEMAITDGMLGIYNQQHAFRLMEKEIARTLRYQSALSLILFDVDDFKSINDTHGHLMGDQVLIELVKKCQQNLRSIDIFGRYGGDEFLILLPETNLADGALVAERIRAAVANMQLSHKKDKIRITLSIGIIQLTEKRATLRELLERADQALYKAKDGGGNQVVRIP